MDRLLFPNRATFQTCAALLCLFGMAALLLYVLRYAGGHLMYSLDDPYIHLSLAENLLRGHYGVNSGEVASPSSSILYPALMAVGLALGFGDATPMVFNAIGAAGTAWLISGALWDASAKTPDDRISPLVYAVVPFLLIAINGYALAFTGMEHTLHTYASVAVIVGLAGLSTKTSPPLWLFIAIIATPLLRFEGFALAGAALLAVALWGYWTRAIFAGVILTAIVGAYIALMTSLNLPIIPSSIMVKSGPAEAVATSQYSAIINEVLAGLRVSLEQRQGRFLAAATVGLLIGMALFRDRPQAQTVARVAAAACVAHLFFGRIDWFSRYEIYILATAITALLIVWGPVFGRHALRIITPVAMIPMFAFTGYSYFQDTWITPLAARNIYTQQYQMHRFSVDYFPEPVAVIDLGWMTYRNDTYVLDLWGLGSETARQLFSTQGRTPDTLRQITQDTVVTYAMLFEEALSDGYPSEWCILAQFTTIRVTSAYETVAFFLIDRTQEDAMRQALNAFADTIPDGTELVQRDCLST